MSYEDTPGAKARQQRYEKTPGGKARKQRYRDKIRRGWRIDPISKKGYYCPYCGEPDRYTATALEPFWSIHETNTRGDHHDLAKNT